MADNVTFQPTVATPPTATVVATDDVGGAQMQRIKVDGGGDGVSVPIVAGQQAMAASLPVVLASNQTAVPVSAATLPLPSGAATAAKQDTQTGLLAGGLPAALGAGGGLKIDGSGTALPVSAAALPLPTGAATEATLATLNGKVTAVNTGAVVVASSALPTGAATAALQQTDALTDTQLRATPVPVSGTVATGGLTDAELRATPVPVSGPLTDTELRAVAVPVSLAAVPLPSGAATAANQTTQITAEQAIQAAVEIMDDWDETDRAKVNLIVGQAGIAAGTGVDGVTVPRVTLATNVALPAGTNAIGKLAANSGVDIGDVDVTSVVPGTGATNLGKAEDAAHASGDVGVEMLAVRVDTPNVALAGTDADYTPVAVSSTGALRTAPPSEDFAALANGPQVKKYYTSAGAVTDGIIWSPAAGKRWYITDIFVNISAAATITLEDDKAGGDEAIWKAELAANSGWSHSFTTPWFSGEDAADLIITTSAGNVYVMVVGYEI